MKAQSTIVAIERTLPASGASPEAIASAWAEWSSKLSAYVELTKPRLTFMVLLTVAAGYLMGARGGANPITLLWTVVGAGLVAAGASAWNQVLERDRDSRMRRTANRPVPSGRVSAPKAGAFGAALTISGALLVALTSNLLAAGVALATFLLYVCVYTPLKSRTTLNTVVGAVPGALPPVIGWAAATNLLGVEALSLFLILFLWQFPHFLAIAWIHRADYERAGYRMLPLLDAEGTLTSGHALMYSLVLIPAGLMPSAIGLAGPYYFLGRWPRAWSTSHPRCGFLGTCLKRTRGGFCGLRFFTSQPSWRFCSPTRCPTAREP